MTIAEHLLRSGADVNITSSKDEIAADVASDDQVLKLLSVSGRFKRLPTLTFFSTTGLVQGAATPTAQSKSMEEPGFVPNYLQHPLFPYYDVQRRLEKAPSSQTAASTAGICQKAVLGDTSDSLTREMDKLHLLTTERILSGALPPSTSSPLLVKVRVSGSGESDFVEVELATPTYHTLVSACCEELEVSLSEVAKIRKLPNVLVRKDRDVQRMTNHQELELVLKEAATSQSDA